MRGASEVSPGERVDGAAGGRVTLHYGAAEGEQTGRGGEAFWGGTVIRALRIIGVYRRKRVNLEHQVGRLEHVRLG